MTTRLAVALVAGAEHDHAAAVLDGFAEATGLDVDIVARAPATDLRGTVDAAFAAGETLDVVAIHTDWLPGLQPWLVPLDDLVDAAPWEPGALALCGTGGSLYALPRTIEVDLLWVRRDLVPKVPRDWAAVAERADAVAAGAGGVAGFGFAGGGGALFELFADLVAAHGGSFFDGDGRPRLATPEVGVALRYLVRLRRTAPFDLTAWSRADAVAAFGTGRVAMVCGPPVTRVQLRATGMLDSCTPRPYPRGPAGLSVRAGCHGFAIAAGSTEPAAARALALTLTGAGMAELDTRVGSLPARRDPTPSHDDTARRVAAAARQTLRRRSPSPPRLAALEPGASEALSALLAGAASPEETRVALQESAETTLGA